MAFPLSTALVSSSKLPNRSVLQLNCLNARIQRTNHLVIVTKCELTESSETGSSSRNLGLKIGSPIIVVEAPKTLKTAASVPCLRINDNLVKAGDVGRIVARKPKDVWAVRLTIGTYLIDGKHFRPLELDE